MQGVDAQYAEIYAGLVQDDSEPSYEADEDTPRTISGSSVTASEAGTASRASAPDTESAGIAKFLRASSVLDTLATPKPSPGTWLSDFDRLISGVEPDKEQLFAVQLDQIRQHLLLLTYLADHTKFTLAIAARTSLLKADKRVASIVFEWLYKIQFPGADLHRYIDRKHQFNVMRLLEASMTVAAKKEEQDLNLKRRKMRQAFTVYEPRGWSSVLPRDFVPYVLPRPAPAISAAASPAPELSAAAQPAVDPKDNSPYGWSAVTAVTEFERPVPTRPVSAALFAVAAGAPAPMPASPAPAPAQ